MSDLTAKKIRELRASSKLSQADLAAKLGVSQGAVSIWERGKGIPTEKISQELKRVLTGATAPEENPIVSPISAWVTSARISKRLSVGELAEKSGVTPPAIYRIEAGITRNLRDGTKRKLEKALGEMPKAAAKEAADEALVSGLGSLEDFDPHSDDKRPAEPGIYVLYDISERPVYVGEGSNIKKRIRDHEEKFWFKRPIVDSASWIKVHDDKLRKQIETILIKFLKSNAVINKQNVHRK